MSFFNRSKNKLAVIDFKFNRIMVVVRKESFLMIFDSLVESTEKYFKYSIFLVSSILN